MVDKNTGKEGKGQAVHEELELHQSHGALLTHRTEGFLSASMWREESSGTGCMQAGSSPPRGVSHLSCLASSSCLLPNWCPIAPPEFFVLFPKRLPALCYCRNKQSLWRNPTQNERAQGATQGHRSQAHGLLTSAGWLCGSQAVSSYAEKSNISCLSGWLEAPSLQQPAMAWPGSLFSSLQSRKGRTGASTVVAGRCAKLKTLTGSDQNPKLGLAKYNTNSSGHFYSN